jgi:hypothetical protein
MQPFGKFALCSALLIAIAPLVPAQAASLRVHDFTFPAGVSRSAAHAIHAQEATSGAIGSPNTVTADAPVTRPNESPCVDTLFTNQSFAVYAGIPFTYAPPVGCPGPYAKIVFNGNFSVSAGVQYDRTASIQIGNAPIYFGTTAEPDPALAPSWHVERDVTDDAALLATTHPGEADIFNIIEPGLNGVISGTAFLQFYPARGHVAAAATPDVVLPFPGVAGGPQPLDTGTSVLTATYTLPTNVDQVFIDVYSQSQQTDEQYFLCAPTNVAAELFACPNTPFRQTEVSIDGTPAGVAPVYPWIFTGGLDPYLWAPIPGVQTLEFKPYRVDLTPFAGVLANGKPHTIGLSVDNADSYFQAIATLYAYEDHGSKHVTGGLTRNTLTVNPNPTVVENLSGTSPSVDGTIAVSDARSYEIDGYVNTSRGRVTTKLAGTLNFVNTQTYSNESPLTGTLETEQSTTASTTVTTSGVGVKTLRRDVVSYPLHVGLVVALDSVGTGTQVTNIDQFYFATHALLGTSGTYASYESNGVQPRDTLDIFEDASITGNSNQYSAQTYIAYDTRGLCYSQTINASKNVISKVSPVTCNPVTAAKTLRAILSQ